MKELSNKRVVETSGERPAPTAKPSPIYRLKRTRIRIKPKKARTSWRSGKIRLDAKGMAELRWTVFCRSQGQCENDIDGIQFVHGEPLRLSVRCPNRISWDYFHLHHIIHRSLGGSDTEENTAAACVPCHSAHHNGGPKISRSAV